ncbi:MAG: hypothetical protein FJX25_05520 [Alphaproteobacteria bacterium]|nr:hypothetical protein [Alphaproteobacteria bacterium]
MSIPPLRNGFVDYVRLLAAFGVVWYHSQAPGDRIAYLAMPFFLVLLGRPSQVRLGRRALLLLQPFLVWSVIYGIVNVVLALINRQAILGWVQADMILTGTAIHLWFLPFAFFVAVIVPFLKAPATALAAPVAAALLVGSLDPQGMTPLPQWLFGLVPALLGVAFFRSGLLSLVSLGVVMAVMGTLRDSPDNLTIGLGTLMGIACLSVHLPATRLSDWCARISLSVYLCHWLILMIADRLGFSSHGLAASGIIGSVLLAVALDMIKTRLSRPQARARLRVMAPAAQDQGS